MAITADRVRQFLDYDASTGVFTWKQLKSNRAANRAWAGCLCKRSKYVLIGIDGRIYPAHRLAWLVTFGYMPDEIDHRDGNRSNNAISNLRECTHAQNQKNIPRPKHNTSGFKGVHAHQGKWRARIMADGKSRSLGMYETKEAAHAAYCAAADALHGEFARHQ